MTSPAAIPPTANGTISGVSCAPPNVHRIACSGRTQRSASGPAEAAPQRIAFGHGKSRRIAGRISRQHVARRAAFLGDLGDVERALLGVGLDRRVLDARQPGALEEALDRAVGRADARPLALLDPARLRLRQADDMQRQPPRRGERLRALVRQARVDQRVGHQPLQILRRLPLHAGGDFFAEQFEEQVGHHASLDQSEWRGFPSPACGRRWPAKAAG